ncbi:MAG: DEAD/DEAH box helicase family protein [Candidatus Caldarchaeum sp.]|jgi:type III restriction enzyme
MSQKNLAVENPIINNPFEEPEYYWEFREGQPTKVQGRRPSGYYIRPKTIDPSQMTLMEEEFVPNNLVNEIRKRVKKWRENGYPGVTPITRQLLEHWRRQDREKRLFFCQVEAAETIIWLIESTPAEKQGLDIPTDNSNESLNEIPPMRRYACKMATGSGKTVVMAMLIAWSIINKIYNPRDTRFSDAVLVVCPNITIKERLQVLIPDNPKNYYDEFDLVPRRLREALNQGFIEVTNWHLFLPRDDSKKKSVLKRGPESDSAFCNRILKKLRNKKNILVINDEAHHAYRPRPLTEEEKEGLTAEEIEEREAATVWIDGLDRINKVRRINFCIDFSATPFYIKGTGYPEGQPFPWTVSDFGLVDAIECGIVKIPRVPVDDNTGDIIPRYFRLWENINKRLPDSERQTARRRARPESVLREADDALKTLASEWKKTFEEWERSNSIVPPVLVIVCDNTELSQLIHQYIVTGNVLEELSNNIGEEVTIRIDTKLLKEAESVIEGETKTKAAELLRKKVDTIGKTEWDGNGDPPGKNVRCVVSVAMLNEGWDAHNVTQILGLRAFTSQLLCEQVVGRGLRRMSYDINPETGLLEPEYVDIYGVPFEVIPVKKKPKSAAQIQKPYTLVKALPERRHLEIKFPRVEGFVIDIRHKVKCDISNVPEIIVSPEGAPTQVVVKPASGTVPERPTRLWVGEEDIHTRDKLYAEKRLQTILFEITSEILSKLKPSKEDVMARQVLFPQILKIVQDYVTQRIRIVGEARLEDIDLLKYKQEIVDRLTASIEPDIDEKDPPILPIIEKFRPLGSTSEVLFRTTKLCFPTTKSHISHVVADSPIWEHTAAFQLEQMPEVISYVKNERLDFTIPYEWLGKRREYRPDYIALLKKPNGEHIHVIIEIKGLENEEDRQKRIAAQKWVKAVNYWGGLGKWTYLVCKNPHELSLQLRQHISTDP